mmetsp:Transcript_34079/g.90840  ORF Transcript_34079/g.90840 Transcript_34079/m.90840 type:complete len:331 (-) Transcript_34079:147-1139(-)
MSELTHVVQSLQKAIHIASGAVVLEPDVADCSAVSSRVDQKHCSARRAGGAKTEISFLAQPATLPCHLAGLQESSMPATISTVSLKCESVCLRRRAAVIAPIDNTDLVFHTFKSPSKILAAFWRHHLHESGELFWPSSGLCTCRKHEQPEPERPRKLSDWGQDARSLPKASWIFQYEFKFVLSRERELLLRPRLLLLRDGLLYESPDSHWRQGVRSDRGKSSVDRNLRILLRRRGFSSRVSNSAAAPGGATVIDATGQLGRLVLSRNGDICTPLVELLIANLDPLRRRLVQSPERRSSRPAHLMLAHGSQSQSCDFGNSRQQEPLQALMR